MWYKKISPVGSLDQSQSTHVTDGRTDGQTELRLPRPRGKNDVPTVRRSSYGFDYWLSVLKQCSVTAGVVGAIVSLPTASI